MKARSDILRMSDDTVKGGFGGSSTDVEIVSQSGFNKQDEKEAVGATSVFLVFMVVRSHLDGSEDEASRIVSNE
ncbi:hypothetical protein OUZ56_005976 [Daphnia magna]|uniref:Uncharacterized protein n=1 Tax=Daphnia magna TaxID=35525 RepID=A0ABQ9YUB2_9CRUS|nr:hypothetical protein OUZ56_005976 [Daphnia magna]